jgi:hypothetical protein
MMANWLHEDMCWELTWSKYHTVGIHIQLHMPVRWSAWCTACHNHLCPDNYTADPGTSHPGCPAQETGTQDLQLLQHRSNQSTWSSSQRTHFFRTLISWFKKEFYDNMIPSDQTYMQGNIFGGRSSSSIINEKNTQRRTSNIQSSWERKNNEWIYYMHQIVDNDESPEGKERCKEFTIGELMNLNERNLRTSSGKKERRSHGYKDSWNARHRVHASWVCHDSKNSILWEKHAYIKVN